jgi:hypothetical protein
METCDVCGSERLVWRKCKQLCLDCGGINRSCADLAEPSAAHADERARLVDS